MKEFDLEAAKAGAPVQTRRGYPVRILAYDRLDHIYPIVALSQNEGKESLAEYTNKGKYYLEENEYDRDLVMVSTGKTGWINVYKGGFSCHPTIFKTKEDALENATGHVVATIEIEWEECLKLMEDCDFNDGILRPIVEKIFNQ